MVSDPVTEPPGLSTRSTIADTESSAAASRSAAAMVSPPALELPERQQLRAAPAADDRAVQGDDGDRRLDLRPGIDGIGGVGPADAVGAGVPRQIQPRRRVVAESASPVSGEMPGAPTSSPIRA